MRIPPQFAAAVGVFLSVPLGAPSPACSARTVDLALGDQDVTITGPPSLGYSSGLATGDLNGDGQQDIALGALAAGCCGEAYVFFGPLASGARIDVAQADVHLYGPENGALGRSLVIADLSGDGLADLCVSDYMACSPRTGRCGGAVFCMYGPLLSGRDVDFRTARPDFTLFGADNLDELGFAAMAADLNSDGHADLVVSACKADGPSNTREDSGEVYALFGPLSPGGIKDLGLDIPDVTVLGADGVSGYIQRGDNLGYALAAGDLTGDGVNDLVIGTHYGDGLGNLRPDAGEVSVLAGPLYSGLVVDLRTDPVAVAVCGDSAYRNAGWSLATGDVNGDFSSDLVIGAPGSSSTTARGIAYVLFGPLAPGTCLDLLTDMPDAEILGADDTDSMGGDVLVADFNADGRNDLAVSSPRAAGPLDARPQAGEAYVFTGPLAGGAVLDPTSTPAALTVFGAHPEDGLQTLSTGDMNNDGVADLLLAAPNVNFGGAGTAYVVFGEETGRLPPEVASGETDLGLLWPPNHRYLCFETGDFQPTITGGCPGPVTWSFSDCPSDQPDDAPETGVGVLRGDGHTTEDCLVLAGGERFYVRAERAAAGPGSRSGRRYAVTVVATDSCGASSQPTVIGFLHVPHDARGLPLSKERGR